MKKFLFLFVACISILGYAQAPDYPQVFSPDAAELGKYGKIPVNYFNGLPSITIPLKEFRAKNYTLPIYLSYHASGNRPENHPGWVGQGWSLHAGGCINRIIRGQKDEMTKAEFDEDKERYEIYLRNKYDEKWERIEYGEDMMLYDTFMREDKGYKIYEYVLDNPGYLYHAEEYQSIYSHLQDYDFSNNYCVEDLYYTFKRHYDYEPDEFQINIEGINASFYLIGNGKVKIVSQSDDDFTVSYSMNTDAPRFGVDHTLEYKFGFESVKVYDTFSEFIVTTKDGTKYHFGGCEDAIEYSIVSCYLDLEYSGDPQDWALKATANTWMLTKIERPDGEEISFTYKHDGTPIVEVDTHRFEYSWLNGIQIPGFNSYKNNNNISFYFLLPSYLTGIDCKYGDNMIVFNRGMSTQLDYDYDRTLFEERVGRTCLYDTVSVHNYYKQLESIDIYDGILDKSNPQRIHFSYTKDPKTRLKLDTVKISAGDCDPLRYIMTYDTTPLPRYYSRKTDMWGYYNYMTKYVPAADRFNKKQYEANLALLQAEMLTKIKYPTGGWTSFEYEPHDYSQIAEQFPFYSYAQIGQAGGLRIKKMTDYSMEGKPEERVFSYKNKNGQSSGVLSGIPKYFVENSVDLNISGASNDSENWLTRLIDKLDYAIFGCDDVFHYLVYSEHMLNQLSDTYGNHVTYSRVTETIPGSGKTVYCYSNHDTQDMSCIDRPPLSTVSNCGDIFSFKSPYNSMALSRGLLLRKSSYNKNGNVVMEEENTYAQDTQDCIYSHNYIEQPIDPYFYAFCRSTTKIYTYYPKLIRKVVKLYPDGGGSPSVEKTDYAYNSHRQLASIVRNNNSNKEETRITYSGDMLNKYPYEEMQSKGIYDRLVEQTVLRDGGIVSSSLITYRKSGNHFVPDKYYESRLNTPIPSDSGLWEQYDGRALSGTQQSVYGAPRITFDSYDSHGNILSATDEGGRSTFYYWDNTGLNPEASFSGMLNPVQTVQVEGTAYEEVDFRDNAAEEYTFEFDADFAGEFSFVMLWPDNIDYSMRGYLDGRSIFVHRKEVILGGGMPRRVRKPDLDTDPIPDPVNELYYGTVTAGHHEFRVIRMAESQSSMHGASFVDLLNGKGTIGYPVYHVEQHAVNQDTWYESFETSNSKTKGFHSDKGWCGRKEFTHTIPSDVPYTIDWMERCGNGKWTYKSSAFTGTKTLGGSAMTIDNVRIYPSAAIATNWTWTPAGELRSETDGSGITTSYKYDGMGRLTTVFDTDDNKLASYAYRNDSPSTIAPDSYVKEWQYTDESGSAAKEKIRYYDGLGRPLQTVSLDAGLLGPCKMNLYEKTEYDAAGRPYKFWLPTRGITWPDSIYSDKEPFSYVEYDGSPLDRPRAEYGPGVAWHANGKAMHYEYKTNGSTALLNVIQYRIDTAKDTTVTVSRDGMVANQTLSVKSVKNEDDLTLLTFTDLFGRIVLERRHPASGEDLDTYYVYDAMGHLAAVLPPALSNMSDSDWNSANVDKYAYLYTYDANGNCTAKKLPGCGWTRYIYDKANRPVFSQDAENRRRGIWMFSFSDIHGRSCVSGYCEGDMETLKSAVSATNVVATRQGTSRWPYMGYSVSGLSLTNPVVLSVSYYDDYSFIDNQVSSAAIRSLMNYSPEYGLTKWDYVHGLPTGGAERILGEGVTNNFLWSSCYYDKKGNLIQTHTTRASGGVDITTTEMTFTGKPNRTHIIHAYGKPEELNEFYEYTYDNWERPDSVRHRLGENAKWITLSKIKYDGIGRVESDARNGIPAMKTSFTYNVRSWTKSVTGPGLSEVMSYENGGQWGGNISKITWSAGTGSEEFQDSYSYDGLSRLTNSTRCMKSDPTRKFINEYSYDGHSNIVQSSYKEQTGSNGIIKNGIWKQFNHDGNRLVSGRIEIGEDNPSRYQFVITSNRQVAYAYDRNGRLTLSEDQGINGIQYNAVGYPSLVETENGGYVQNKYTAGGTKLESRRTDAEGVTTAMAYEGNEVIENGHRRMLLFDGGYVDFSGNEPRYCWYTKDHLGSVRAVADADGNVFSTYAFKPYGEDFSVENPATSYSELGPVTDEGIDSNLLYVPIYPGGQSQPSGISAFMIEDEEELEAPLVTYSAPAAPNWQPYKFSGKESLTRVGLDLYDFGARMYSPSNTRWMSMDPLAEKYYHVSPYVYCASNPLNIVDPDGMQWYLCTHYNGITTYKYYEGEMPEEEKSKYRNVEDKGYYFFDNENNRYYSLFGIVFKSTTQEMMNYCLITNMIDRLVYRFFMNFEDGETGEINKTTTYIPSLKIDHIYPIISYRGKTFCTKPFDGRYKHDLTHNSRFWNNLDQKANIYPAHMPIQNTTNLGYAQKGDAYWLFANNPASAARGGARVVQLEFTYTDAQAFLKSCVKLFPKTENTEKMKNYIHE